MHNPEEMVPRGLAAREWNVSTRSVARWEKAKLPGIDEPIFVNGRVYHRRKKLESAKHNRLSGEEAR